MTDLHKPLGQDRKPKGNRRVPPGLFTALALVLVGVAGYSIYQSRQSDSTVVSLNDAAVAPIKPVVQTDPKDNNSESSTPTEATKPEPDQVAINRPEPPSFTPKKGKANRRSPGIPNPDLVEKSEFGPLPKVADSGLRPLDAYAVPTSTVTSVRIAIVMGGLGVSQTASKQAIETLPSSVTLAYSPVGNSLQRWMQVARKEGHEVALQLPMEPLGYPSIDPGKSTLGSDATAGQNLANLRWSLGRMSNYPVVMNYLGANFTNNPRALRPILEEVKARGLGWLDDGSVQASKSLDIAEEIRLPHAVGNFVLDTRNDAPAIADKLKVLELYARKRGYAVASATAFPATVKQVTKWVKDAEKRGIQIVPLSNLIRDYSR